MVPYRQRHDHQARHGCKIVRQAGVNVLDRIMAMRILTDGGASCGVLGWDVRSGEYVIIRAKTVVFPPRPFGHQGTDNSTHNAFNVWMYPYNTSAGVVLGYEAGPQLQNSIPTSARQCCPRASAVRA